MRSRRCLSTTGLLAAALAVIALYASLAIAQDVPSDDASVEKLLLGTWLVDDREFEFDDTKIHHRDGIFHITARLADGTYSVLVTIATHISNRDGSDRPHRACDGKPTCIQNGATEGIGVYSNGRFRVDYYGENWIDDVFTVSGRTMSGRDLNGPIFMRKK